MSEELPARIAVVHDWLVDYAGSERVLAEILRCLPRADLLALVDHFAANSRFIARRIAKARERLQRARAFLFAAVEDFGIAPIEAMACGTPEGPPR